MEKRAHTPPSQLIFLPLAVASTGVRNGQSLDLKLMRALGCERQGGVVKI